MQLVFLVRKVQEFFSYRRVKNNYLELDSLVKCLHFFIGTCPIYYEEPCRPELVKFILSTNQKNHSNLYELDPFNLRLPETFNPSLPTKILIHGFGGLQIDRGIKSIYRAYQKLGYNIIIGKSII